MIGLKVQIESIELGALYMGNLYNLWISAKTLSGVSIRIFDHRTILLDVILELPKQIIVLLIPFIGKDVDLTSTSDEGIIFTVIESNWTSYTDSYKTSDFWPVSVDRLSEFSLLSVYDGYVLINKEYVSRNQINGYLRISEKINRWDLLAIGWD